MFATWAFVVLGLAAAVLGEHSSACIALANPDEAKTLPSTFEFQGREVLISFPPKYRRSKPSSLVLVYHDKGMSAQDMQDVTEFSNPSMNSRAIVVYLSAHKGHWMSDPESNFVAKLDSFDSTGDDPTNDIFYTRYLLDHLEESYCLNKRRVYAVGLGTGGGMMHQLACQPQMSRRVAAFAAVAGAFYRGDDEDRFWGKCMLGRRPIPVLEIHGADDEIYPLKSTKGNLLSAEEWVAKWRDLNVCGRPVGKPAASKDSNASVMTELEHGQLSETLSYAGGAIKSAYRCGVWSDRTNNDLSVEEKELRRISVLHYSVKGFGHGWPRVQVKQEEEVEFKDNKVKPTGSRNFDAGGVVLNFFNHHRLPDSATIQAQLRKLFVERGAKVHDERKVPEMSIHKEL